MIAQEHPCNSVRFFEHENGGGGHPRKSKATSKLPNPSEVFKKDRKRQAGNDKKKVDESDTTGRAPKESSAKVQKDCLFLFCSYSTTFAPYLPFKTYSNPDIFKLISLGKNQRKLLSNQHNLE